MTPVAVKETRPSLPRRIARRVLHKRTLVAFASAIALVILFHYMLMPWLVRDRVRAALDEAGLDNAKFRVTRATLWATDIRDLVLDDQNRINRVQVRYNVHDLWQREVNEIAVSGATLSADPRNWPIEKKTPATTTTTTQPKRAALNLPFNHLRLENSQLLLPSGEKIPVAGTLSRSLSDFIFHVASPDRGLNVSGTLTPRGEGTLAIDATNVTADLIDAILRTYVHSAAVSVTGNISGKIRGKWDGSGGVSGHAALEIAGGSIDNASGAKLTLGSGVFVGEASIGGGQTTSQPAATLSIKADRADLATPDLKAYGVGGAVTLISLSPPVSPPRQKLSAQRLKIGETEFANGQLEFEVTETGDILIRQTRWDFLGGQVYANDVQVPRKGPTRLTLRAENVDLRDILQAYAKDKLEGRGKVSGELPIVIDGPNITFGEGQITAGDGGELRIKDQDTLAQVSELAGGAAVTPVRGGSSDQVKRNIAEALKDFEYDRLTARLTNEADPGGKGGRGLVAYVNLKGHGRTGAKQAIEYDARISGLDDLLRSYLHISEALDRPMHLRQPPATPQPHAATTTPATTSATGKVESK
jgi:hypothetical protein